MVYLVSTKILTHKQCAIISRIMVLKPNGISLPSHRKSPCDRIWWYS